MKMLYDIIAGIISMIAKSLGVSYATANVAWSLYLQGLVCILSCLLLLIPMRKRYKHSAWMCSPYQEQPPFLDMHT